MSAVQAEREKVSEARGSLYLDRAAEYWGQKQPAIVKCAQAKPFDQIDGLNMWFAQREFLCTDTRWLTSAYEWNEWFGEVRAYTVCPEPDPASYAGWNDAYHGTIPYAIANIARYGKLLASEKKSLGHSTLTDGPGVYATPVEWTAWEYAIAQQLFDNGRYFRCICHVKTNPEVKNLPNQNRSKVNKQWIHLKRTVILLRILIATNAPPGAGNIRIEI